MVGIQGLNYLLKGYLRTANNIKAITCNISKYLFDQQDRTDHIIKQFSNCLLDTTECILIQINKSGSHYILVVLDLKSKKYYYLDPFGIHKNYGQIKKICALIDI